MAQGIEKEIIFCFKGRPVPLQKENAVSYISTVSLVLTVEPRVTALTLKCTNRFAMYTM